MSDPYGDREFLEKRRAKPPYTLDPMLAATPSPRTTKPSSEKHHTKDKHKSSTTPRSGVYQWRKRSIRYRFSDGITYRGKPTVEVAERTVAIIHAAHIDGLTVTQLCDTFDTNSRIIRHALSAPSSQAIKRDMLSRLKSGADLRAWAALIDNTKCGEPRTEVGAAVAILDRLEGKPQQRVTIQSEHTETVRFVVEAAAPAQLQDMVKDPESGRWVSPNEIKQLAGPSGPASGK